MNDSAHGVTADKPEQPENDQDHRNRVQHIWLRGASTSAGGHTPFGGGEG
jgi:hypothetical protein